jgi:hypothetical protein
LTLRKKTFPKKLTIHQEGLCHHCKSRNKVALRQKHFAEQSEQRASHWASPFPKRGVCGVLRIGLGFGVRVGKVAERLGLWRPGKNLGKNSLLRAGFGQVARILL